MYLIRSESPQGETSYKIGITRRAVAKRVKELQTGNPNVLELVTTYDSIHGTRLEAVLHRSYPQVHNEWFCLSIDEVLGFKNMCQKIEGTLQLLEQNSYWKRHDQGHRPPDDEW